MNQLKIEQSKDPIIQNKIKQQKQNPTKYSYVFQDGMLYKLMLMRNNCMTKSKLIYLPSSMIDSLLKAYHTDTFEGYFDIQRTYLKIKNNFWWPNMKQSISQHIQSSFLSCQQHRIDPRHDINEEVLIKVHDPSLKSGSDYSFDPKLIIEKQHPIY